MKNKKGMSLLEMVWVIVILGVAIPVLLRMWADVAWRGARAETLADAACYVQELMEEIQSKRFDENTDAPWSAVLGPEAGETSRSAYDDIDDFNNYTDTPVTGYTRRVSIRYAILNGATWGVSGSATDFKEIRVAVSHNRNFFANAEMVTVESTY